MAARALSILLVFYWHLVAYQSSYNYVGYDILILRDWITVCTEFVVHVWSVESPEAKETEVGEVVLSL